MLQPNNFEPSKKAPDNLMVDSTLNRVNRGGHPAVSRSLNRKQRRNLVRANGGFKTKHRGIWLYANQHARHLREQESK